MKTSVVCICICVVVVSPLASGAETPWEEQLVEMGHHIYRLSAINAINGLNLSPDQVRQLRALAETLALAAPKPPPMKGKLYEGLSDVRKTYNELREVLLRGEDVPEGLKARVAQARAQESEVIRATLSVPPVPGDRGRCTRCHATPDRFSSEEKTPMLDALLTGNSPMTFQNKRGVAYAHIDGMLGLRGILTTAQLAPRVDVILTDGQKRIMRDFTCCLIPPAELSDPVRAGQAEVSEASIKVLRQVRALPDAYWERYHPRLLDTIARFDDMKYPGLTNEERQDRRKNVKELLERARAMSEVEFEMSKETLGADLELDRTPQTNERQQRFMTAFFLLLPGSKDVYDALQKRMDAR